MIKTLFNKLFFVVFSGALIFGFVACEDDFLSETSGKALIFSQDTLAFDTVFTTVGSATSKILVYNPHNKAFKINNISLTGGSVSSFRINVDGAISTNNSFNDIVIRAKDSLYIFVEITINPLLENAPVLVQDSIMFNYGNVHQRVLLEAYGQDMVPLKNVEIKNDVTYNADKPYLVYGDLIVDSAKTLTLSPGCKLYFHNNARLLVYGNLRAEGTYEAPVVLRGDRMDKIKFVTPIPYKYVAGQWGGVYLLSKTGQHLLKHVNISSGYVGVYFYNTDLRYRPTLEIVNSVIHNSLLYNVVALNGDLTVANSEISNSGSYTVFLSGGRHKFYHCTVANYFEFNQFQPVSRDKTPAVMLMDLNRTLPMETVFENCIVTGTSAYEFTLASKFPDKYKGVIRNSYIRRPEPSELTIFNDIRWYQQNDTVFKNTRFDYEKGRYFDFTPDSVSPACGLANPVISNQFRLDLHGKDRLKDGDPDAGAYEWYPASSAE
ncbi:MAG: hypothetical protein VB102_02555 [Paludibacter sp.]|nr:hypothetical protein [Paludibacter sp.]